MRVSVLAGDGKNIAAAAAAADRADVAAAAAVCAVVCDQNMPVSFAPTQHLFSRRTSLS